MQRHSLVLVFVVLSFVLLVTTPLIAAAVFTANKSFNFGHVVVVALIAHHDECAIGSRLTNKIAFVSKTVIAVATQAELEPFAFFSALLFREIHEGNARILNLILFFKKYGKFAASNQL